MNAIVADKILYCDAPLRDAVPYLPPILRLQNGRVFFSKSVKKSVKRGVRSFTRAKRASLTCSLPHIYPFTYRFYQKR